MDQPGSITPSRLAHETLRVTNNFPIFSDGFIKSLHDDFSRKGTVAVSKNDEFLTRGTSLSCAYRLLI